MILIKLYIERSYNDMMTYTSSFWEKGKQTVYECIQ